MKLEALLPVLKALQGKCYDDMADEKTDPEEKLASAIEGAEEDVGYDLDGDDEAGEEHLGEVMPADEGGEVLVEEEDPDRAALQEFFKSKKPAPPRPGTAVIIASDSKKKPIGRKSMKDLV